MPRSASVRRCRCARSVRDTYGDLAAPLAGELMARVRALVPVLPVPLLAQVLVEQGPLERPELEAAFAALVDRLRAAGAYVHVPRGSVTLGLRLAREHLVLRGLVTEGETTAIVDGNRDLIAYYAASIAQLLPDAAAQPEAMLH